MSVTLQILTEPSGSQLTSAIASDESADKNDFPIYITGNGNFTLEQDDITLSAVDSSNNDISSDVSIVSFEGQNSTYKAIVRPMEEAGILTVDIAENAVPEGNTAVSQDIRVSTEFPDTDAEVPTLLFAHNVGGLTGSLGIATMPTGILVYRATTSTGAAFAEFEFDGTSIRTQLLTQTNSALGGVDFINGDVLALRNPVGAGRIYRYDLENLSALSSNEVISLTSNPASKGITHTRLGYTFTKTGIISTLPYDSTDESDATDHDIDDFPIGTSTIIAHQNDLIYAFTNTGNGAGIVEITSDDNLEFRKHVNINNIISNVNYQDVAIYRDTMYFVYSDSVYTLKIRHYRPMAKNTKTTIYPVFATNGDTIPLKQFAPDAKDFTFSVGFDKPSYLSINASHEIAIASDAVTETTPVLVKVTGINYIDSVDFSFYLIIELATAPVWRDVDNLSMRDNSTYNLHQIVDADSIALQSGPTGSSVSDGVFTIGTTGGNATFRATKDGLTTDKTIQIDLIQASTPDNFSDTFRYTVEIAGIDVTEDLLKTVPIRVSKSSDNIELTKYRTNSVDIALNNANDKYDPDADDNFWDENSLNAGGYQEDIKVYLESFISGAWVSHPLFSGIIQGQAGVVSAVRVNLTAVEISVNLERLDIPGFGQLTKWDMLRKLSDEDSFEGIYVPEGSLVPIQPKTAAAYHDRTQLTRSSLQLPTHGPALANTMYVSASDVRVSGGFFEEGLPVAKFKTYPRSKSIEVLLNLLSIAGTVYNIEIEVPEVTLERPTVFNQGSVPFAVEATRTTRLPADWVYDATHKQILILLSNPESHIADLLVQLDVARKSYQVLRTFAKDVKVHRIERRDATNYYILTSGAITQDRSAQTLPRPSDSTAYAYDAIAEGIEIKIHHFNTSTGALTEHVAEDNARPPQLGVHYHAGFENALYIDEFEGILPHDRGAFKWYSGNLYYRYATDSEFGVARVNASGTTSEMVSQSSLSYWNWLNFAFDVDTSNGDVYFVYATGYTTSNISLGSGSWQGGVASDNRLYFINDTPNTAVAYDYSGTRQSGDDISLGSGSWQGGVASDNRLYFINDTPNTAVAYDYSGTRQSGDDISLGSGSWQGGVASNNRLYFINDTPNTAVAYDYSGTRQSGDDISLGSGSWQGGVASNNRLYFINDTPNTAVAYDYSGTRQSGDDISLGTGLWLGGVASDNSFHLISVTAGGIGTAFAYDFDGNRQEVSFSSLVIKKRDSGGTETTVLTDTQLLHPFSDLSGGGAYLGCHEALFHNDNLYMICPIQRVDEDSGTYTRSREKSAGAILYRCDLTAATPSLTLIEKWDFVQLSGCDLTIHDGAVHYMEQPIAASQFKLVNPDLESYNASMGYNIVPEALGALKKVDASGDVESLGSLWYEGDRAYNRALTRALSIEEHLHIMMGYGDTRELLKYNSLASKADNCVHLIYGKKLQFVLPTFQPTGNVYSEITEIARKIGATVSFNNNLISIKDRRNFRAEVDGGITDSAVSVAFDAMNRTFPSSGHLKIDTEFLQYTGISGGSFTGVTRGVLGTDAAAHADETDILFMDALLSSEEIIKIDRNIDTTRYFNKIQDENDIYEVSDEAGIEKYNNQPYTLDLGLTRNENAWIETLFKQYLSENKTLGKQFDLTLVAGQTANALDIGQVVGIAQASRIETLRIESITYSQKRVKISARTV